MACFGHTGVRSTAQYCVAIIESTASTIRNERSRLFDLNVERFISNLQIKSFATHDECESLPFGRNRSQAIWRPILEALTSRSGRP